jgi:hypothetical protein
VTGTVTKILVVEKNKAKATVYSHAGYALHKALSPKDVW